MFASPREVWSPAESQTVEGCLVRLGASAGKYADGRRRYRFECAWNSMQMWVVPRKFCLSSQLGGKAFIFHNLRGVRIETET